MLKLNLVEMVLDDLQSISRVEASAKYQVSEATIQNWKARKTEPNAFALQLVLDRYYATQHDVSIWEGKKVFFLLPVYDRVSIGYMFSIMRNIFRYGPDKVGYFVEERTTIVDGRNALVDMFLRTQGEWAIFIDSDMILPVGDAGMYAKFGAKLPEQLQSVLFLDRIMKSDKPIVGGLYFGRGKNGRAQYAEAFENEEENRRAHMMSNAGLKQTKWVATGGMRIHRSVFERMKEEAPKAFPEIIPKNKGFPWGFFNQLHAGIGEDVSFCLRAGKIGIPSFVDTACICMHEGKTYFGPHNTIG